MVVADQAYDGSVTDPHEPAETTEPAKASEAEELEERQALEDLPDRGRLRSFRDVNLTVGQFMAGLEQKILHNRPPAVVIVSEEARGEQVQTNGLVIGNLPTKALDRPEPPDDSGVVL